MPADTQTENRRLDVMADPKAVAPQSRQGQPSLGQRQRTNHHAGLNAEQVVERYYTGRGARALERRWRGPGGEIDLIFAEGNRIVFVEVKTSRTHAKAAERVTPRQVARIHASAESYLGQCSSGLLTEARFDVALVDALGRVAIIANAGMAA